MFEYFIWLITIFPALKLQTHLIAYTYIDVQTYNSYYIFSVWMFFMWDTLFMLSQPV